MQVNLSYQTEFDTPQSSLTVQLMIHMQRILPFYDTYLNKSISHQINLYYSLIGNQPALFQCIDLT